MALRQEAHVGVDAQSGFVHTVLGTAANVADITQAGALLHGDEADAFGDAGYQGVHKRQEARAPRWHVAMRPGRRRLLHPSREWARLLEQAEQLKASVRAKVEHPFHVIKNQFRHKKVRCKGLAKNQAQLVSLFGLANLVIAKRPLLNLHARGAPCTGKVASQRPKTLTTEPSETRSRSCPTDFGPSTARTSSAALIAQRFLSII